MTGRDRLRPWKGAMTVAAMAGGPLVTASAARAEGFVDLMAGASTSDARPATLRADDASVAGTRVPTELSVRIDRLRTTSWTTYAGRAGYWWGHFGAALDLAKVAPDVRRQSVAASANLRFDETVFGEPVVIDPGRTIGVNIPALRVPDTASISAVAMIRGARRGISPYLYAGPSYLVTSKRFSGSFGLLAGAGLSVPIVGPLSLVGEYRFQSVDADPVAGRARGRIDGTPVDSGGVRVGFRLRNHSLLGGLRLRL